MNCESADSSIPEEPTVSRQPSLDRLGLHSTGQRNSFIEHICWTLKVKRLARTLIESKSNSIQVRLREAGQIRAFWKVLPQQARPITTSQICFNGP